MIDYTEGHGSVLKVREVRLHIILLSDKLKFFFNFDYYATHAHCMSLRFIINLEHVYGLYFSHHFYTLQILIQRTRSH